MFNQKRRPHRFTKEHLSEAFVKHLDREKGLQDLIELMIESMMMAKRREFLSYSEGNKGDDFRRGRSYGQDRVLEYRIHRERYRTFIPLTLSVFEIRKKNVSLW